MKKKERMLEKKKKNIRRKQYVRVTCVRNVEVMCLREVGVASFSRGQTWLWNECFPGIWISPEINEFRPKFGHLGPDRYIHLPGEIF